MPAIKAISRIARALLIGFVLAGPASAQRFNEGLLNSFQFRNMGPFRTGAWVTDFAVPETPAREHLRTFYVATRNGGVWKTTNNGTTYEPVFDGAGPQTIGAVAVAPSDHNVVWVGTGESYVARYSYSGDGVYKSTDAGRTWQKMGLEDSHHIAKIIVHPANPDIVYVASMGHLHTPNAERGVFRTQDGGRTWQKVLYVDDRIGVIDMVLVPSQPDVLYAATYEKVRYPWHLEIGGPGSGIYKTTNGGANWTRLTGGLPDGRIGRIGLDVFRKNPNILYAVFENANPRAGARGGGGGRGEVYRTDDAGATWRITHGPEVNVGGKAPYSFNILRVDPANDQRAYVTSDALLVTTDGGKTWGRGNPPLFTRMFGDVRNVWVDPQDPERIFVGSDGGVNITYDGGRNIDFLPNLPIGEIYALTVDMADPYNIYVGLQDHESWRGPVNGFAGNTDLSSWVTVGTGDGMYQAVDPTDNRWAYNTLQFGGHVRVDQQLGTMTQIAPSRQEFPGLRATWTTPIVLSPHEPKVLYTGGQYLLRSPDRGDTWQRISPDLTSNDSTKINGAGNIQYCTITTIEESSRTRGLIWVGTDDGRVHVTRDDGKTWTDLTPKLTAAGAPRDYWVTRVAASKHNPGTAYVTITGFHRDDFKAYVYRTDDFGATFRSLGATLPLAPANVIAEDHKNPSLLFFGSDRGLFVSIDAGANWVRMKSNMPALLPVRDLVVHPRENDLVVGTHGRGVYVTDISPLQELTEQVLAKNAHLFAVEPRSWRVESGWGNYRLFGARHIVTPNEPNGLVITFYQSESAPATVRVLNTAGTEIWSQQQQGATGIRRVVWNMRAGGGGVAAGGRRGGGGGALVEPGDYTVVLEVGGTKLTQTARVKPPVVLPRGFAGVPAPGG